MIDTEFENVPVFAWNSHVTMISPTTISNFELAKCSNFDKDIGESTKKLCE